MSFRIIRNVTALLLLVLFSPCLLGAREEGAQPQSAPTAVTVSGVVIDIRDYPGPPGQLPSLARDLITLKPGQAFSQEALDGSVSLLTLSGRFGDVAAETREGTEGLEVVFHLTPYLLIRDIRFSGLYPLFEEDILTAMTAFVGSALQPDTVSSQEGLIAQFLRNEGFVDPKVKVAAADTREDGTVVLDVSLDKGPYFRLTSLGITGNRSFSDTRLKPRMNIWIRSFFRGSSGRFIEKSLTQDVKDLASFYWAKGYSDAQVSSSLDRNTDTGNIKVTVSIKEGPLYKVSYTGNRSFYTLGLNKQLVLFKEGNRGGSGVRKSARNIRELYLGSGFPDVKVKPVVETLTEDGREVRKVRFEIDEGSRAVVDSVEFSGNTAFDKDDLLEKIGTGKKTNPILGKRLFSRDVLMQDIQTITALYGDQGYTSAAVGADLRWSTDKTGVSVVFSITEGVRTLVSSVSIEGAASLSPGRARECIRLKEGGPFNRTILKNDEASLATCISEQGYPRVQVQSSAITSKDGREAYVKYTVDQGRLVTMGNTYFSGNFMTRRRIMKRELDMDEGDPFSLNKMVKGQNAIRDMNVFNTVKFKTLGLRENQDHVTVVADLEEKKPYYVQTSVGYESYAGEYVNARIGDHNLFGLNRDVWLGAGISQVSERYELGVNAPRLLGTRVSGVYNLYWEKREDFNQNFGLRTLGYNLGLIKRFGRRVFTVVNLSYEKRNEYIVDEAQQAQLDEGKSPEELADEAETLKPRSIVVVSPGITYDTRDSFLHPKNGNFTYGAFDLSQGLKNSQDVDNFIRYRADVREYTSPFDRLTFAWMGKVGYIMPTNNTDVLPDDQLFYLGGSLNVRGYRENMLLYDGNNNPVGGRFSLASSLEARLALIDGIELALFFDAGTIRDTNANSVVPETRASYGTGLRYITPIGPISLVYGHKLSPEPGESPYEWHFSLGYTF